MAVVSMPCSPRDRRTCNEFLTQSETLSCSFIARHRITSVSKAKHSKERGGTGKESLASLHCASKLETLIQSSMSSEAYSRRDTIWKSHQALRCISHRNCGAPGFKTLSATMRPPSDMRF